MNALFASVKNNRLLAIIGLVIFMASPALLMWASDPSFYDSDEMESWMDEPWVEEQMRLSETRIASRFRKYEVRPRNPQTDLLIGAFRNPRLFRNPSADHILTNLGHMNINDTGELLRAVPSGLRKRAGRPTRTDRGTLGEGLNYLTLSESAVGRGPNKIYKEIRDLGGVIVNYGRNNTVSAYLPKSAVERLRGRSDDFRFTMAYSPVFKLALGVGRRELINQERNNSLDLLLDVTIVPGLDLKGAARAISGIPGVHGVTENPFGSVLQVNARFTAVRGILNRPEVSWVQGTPEYALHNMEGSPGVQVGDLEDARGARPFDLAGVDGGGLDTNGDGVRNNDPGSTDEVRPQIVGVIDNGISLDQPGFSHTATQATIPFVGAIGPLHRKVHALQDVADPTLSTCDSLLSGSGTHGNVVASTIAANASEIGFLFTRNELAGTGVNENLDGIARGARILFQDAASPTRCTTNELIEKGGEVNPGSLIARMNEMICPITGGVGACAGIIGGENDIHLAVLPFGTPNFSSARTIVENGTYPQQSADLDIFLYNNRDFMIVAPVGNKGGIADGARHQLIDNDVPNLFDGSASNDVDGDGNPLPDIPVQTSPPATAKNIISVGSTGMDVITLFGPSNGPHNTPSNSSSKGPATPQSLRMAPVLLAPGRDGHAIFGTPGTIGIAVFRSSDNDNSGKVVAQIDEQNAGGSYAAGYVTGAGALTRDYFAKGFYPSGTRVDADRIDSLSGSLVKATLIASANHSESASTNGFDQDEERILRSTRCTNLGTVGNDQVGIMCNSWIGYGRVVLTQALPLAVWPSSHIHDPGLLTAESPADSLLIFDYMATGEGLLGNDDVHPSSRSHTFVVNSANQVTGAGGCQAVASAQLRVALAWTDIPSAPGSGGVLVNDLDLVVQSPGADKMLDTLDDVYYDGNNYGIAAQNANLDQWSFGTSQGLGCSETLSCSEPGGDCSAAGDTCGALACSDETGDCSASNSGDSCGTIVCTNGTSDCSVSNPGDPCGALTCSDGVGDCSASNPGDTCGALACSDATGDCSASNPGDPCGVDGTCAAPFCETLYVCEIPGTCAGIGNCQSNSCDGLVLGAACGEAGSCVPSPRPEIHDPNNPQEAVHLTSDTNADGSFADSTLCTGTWRVTVKAAGTLVIAGGEGCTEDTNGNYRLDDGEDGGCGTTDGLLDLGGQSYSIVVAGPVLHDAADGLPALGPMSFPSSSLVFAQTRFACDDNAGLTIFDSTAGAGVARSTSSTTFSVVDADGNTLDTEASIAFTPGAVAGSTTTTIPVRLADPAIPNNGILEAETDQFIVATYAPAGQRPVTARGEVDCSPDLIPNFFALYAGIGFGTQELLSQGCDDDESFDGGETVTYGVLFTNRDSVQGFSDLIATLTPSGPGAAAVRVLDSPRDTGPLPLGGTNSAFFHVFVDEAAANALAISDRVVTMTLTLESLTKGQVASRQSFEFVHPINTDEQRHHYSTDFPDGSGGSIVRDLNRNLIIDKPDTVDPFRLIVLPDEVVEFDSIFFVDPDSGFITNTLGEDLDGDGILDAGEDTIPNGVLDPGILASGTPADSHNVPWDLDRNDGGWFALRHAQSVPGSLTAPVWEYETGDLCGAQTSLGDIHGIWHTGDTDQATPADNAQRCDEHAQPGNPATAPVHEFMFDVLHSPIIQKVHQSPDARGFPYTVEFQRFAMNITTQIYDAYAGGSVNIVNDIDFDGANCLMCQEHNVYTSRRFGGQYYSWFSFAGQYFDDPNPGIHAGGTIPEQRTFGPASAETILPTTGLSNPNQFEDPMPPAPPDQLPFPLPGPTPVPGVCVGGTTPGILCADSAECSGGTCVIESNTTAGPVRNFESTLVGFEGGLAFVIDGTNETGTAGQGIPGKGGNRWQIGIGFFALESRTGETDYGFGVDDVVFEWDESHPEDEVALGNLPACDRFNTPGNPAGGQCATITVDRTSLFECEESLDITVFDPKIPLASSVEVSIVTDTDSIQFNSLRFSVLRPNDKRYTLNAVPGEPGLFRDSVIISSLANTENNIFVTAASDQNLIVYYSDPLCDGDNDGEINESSFDNIDGDGIADADDNCGLIHNPGQEDADGDGIGDLCDNCVNNANPSQDDTNADGIGDACEFDDVDGDGIANPDDNCKDVYNPDQTPGTGGKGEACDNASNNASVADGDGIGDRNDNCILVNNPSQTDTDNDGLGDACDGDCVGVFGELVCSVDATTCGTLGASCGPVNRCATDETFCTTLGDPCDTPFLECDADGSACGVIGEACGAGFLLCDEDAAACGVIGEACGAISLECDEDASACAEIGEACGTAGMCVEVQTGMCVEVQTGTCVETTPVCTEFFGTCQTAVRHTTGSCSIVNDDADQDGVPDALDLCAAIPNPPVVPGTLRQSDVDRDGLGDECDPDGSLDDDFDGIPDDLPSFAITVSCGATAVAAFAVLATSYVDIDGDLDPFPDTGEVGNVSVVLQNLGSALTNATFIMGSLDPNVECITQSTAVVAAIASGETFELTGLQFKASDALQSESGSNAAKLEFCINVVADQTLGTSSETCFSLPADLDIPPGVVQTPVNGPDGLFGTADDGILGETFDIDKNGNGILDVGDTFLVPTFDAGSGSFTFSGDSGFYIQGSETGATLNTATAIACGGFSTPEQGNPRCSLDDDFMMDWHYHCAPGASLDTDTTDVNGDGITDNPGCPNSEILPDGTARFDPVSQTYPGCAGGCSYQTPADGTKGLSTPNSLHMGAHFDLTFARSGDTTHLRTLQAFVTPPINLKVADILPGELELTFFHIADLMDNNQVNLPDGECGDCADVQIQVDLNPDPANDEWGNWDKLVPFQNVYDHTANSAPFGPAYCAMTPTDTGVAPPAPRGVHETMCLPQGLWSNCGSDVATTVAAVGQCAGPGFLDPGGSGVWIESKFNLAPFLGQRVRIRWIGMSWRFFDGQSYFQIGGGWDGVVEDDGWWLDDITITGSVVDPVTPGADFDPPPADPFLECPTAGGECDESIGDNGTSATLVATNENAAPLGGGVIAQAGDVLNISASDSTLPGGCTDGSAQFQFTKDGVLVQDWSSKTFYADAPVTDATYSVQVRCSSDFSCTSTSGAQTSVAVYSGDGGDIDLNADHATASVELSWDGRPQPPSMAGYDLFKGSVPPSDSGLGTLSALQCNISQAALLQAVDSNVPAVDTAFYYLAGHRSVTADALTHLGRESDGSVRTAGFVCTP